MLCSAPTLIRTGRPMDAGPAKRVKTTTACEYCRKRKSKCDGVRPSCRACRESDRHPCVYPETPTRKLVFKQVQFVEDGDGDGGAADQRRLQPTVDRQPLNTTARPEAPSTPPVSSPEPLLSRSTPLSIPFFRWFGPTGISPGHNRFFVPIENEPDPDEAPRPQRSLLRNRESGPKDGSGAAASPIRQLDQRLFEAGDNSTPSAEVLFPLLETFFEYYGCHFPFQPEQSFVQSVKESRVSALLLNSMCAMAARFSSLPMFQGQPAYARGEPFCDKAKHLLVPLLNMPSAEVVQSMMMIAWLELATCRDVGHWMYTGMAVRMAEDMGLHKQALSSHNDEARLLYWAIYVWDHIICFAVGRPLTIRREDVDIALPRQRLIQSEPFELADPFPSLVQVIQHLGLVHDVIRTLADSPLEAVPKARQLLLAHQEGLVSHFSKMHPSLAFNIPNFKAHATKGQGGTYLLLHLWFNSVMIALHRPGLRYGEQQRCGIDLLGPDSRHISLSLARTSSSMLSIAELVDVKSILGSPFIDQAIELAGLVFVAELRLPAVLDLADTGEFISNRVREHDHETNYQVCSRALQLLTVYWRGIIWLWTQMQQEHQSIQYTTHSADAVDPYMSIWLSDCQMIERFLQDTENGEPQDNAFGVAVAGTTHSCEKRTVTVIGQSSQSDSVDSQTDLAWTSLPGNTWNFGHSVPE
ncbi:fungal-specific transcription factor domain-containing protein [Xylariales sp. PMI_506]|nr:fungal-specific transcription factor domain-containing protein [Xylariales sp. PMI_506]